MGMFDRFYLLKHIVCPNCRTDENTHVPIDFKGKEIISGLNVVMLHDEKGGLKEFQTKDLENVMAIYNLPGEIPAEDIRLNHLQNGINAYAGCNNCGTFWEGTVFLEQVDNKTIFVSRLEAEGLCDESTMMYEDRICTHPLYDIEVEQELMSTEERRKTKITVTPKLDECINYIKGQIQDATQKGKRYESAIEELRKRISNHDKEMHRLGRLLNHAKKCAEIPSYKPCQDKRKEIIHLEDQDDKAFFYEQKMENLLIALAYFNETIDPEHSKSLILDQGLAEQYVHERKFLEGVKRLDRRSAVLGRGASDCLRMLLGISYSKLKDSNLNQ